MSGVDAKEHVRHVTIRQINSSERMHETAPLKVDGAEVSSLIVVANIFDWRRRGSGFLSFCLDDGTDRMDRSSRFKCFLSEETVGEGMVEFDHFAYVRLLLKPRKKHYIEVTSLTAVTDPHEIFYHTLKVIEDSLLVKKGKPPSNGRPSNLSESPGTVAAQPEIDSRTQSVGVVQQGSFAGSPSPTWRTCRRSTFNEERHGESPTGYGGGGHGDDDDDDDDDDDKMDLGSIEQSDFFSSVVHVEKYNPPTHLRSSTSPPQRRSRRDARSPRKGLARH